MEWLPLFLFVAIYLVASRAVHGWRDLGVWLALTAALVFLIKLTGLSTENAFVYDAGPPRHWSLTLTLTVTIALLITASLMLLVKEIRLRRNERRGD